MEKNPTDKKIDNIVRESVDPVLESERGSYFSRREVLDHMATAVRKKSLDQRRRLLKYYQEGTLSRRNFLKMLGLSVGGVAVTSAGGWFWGEQIFDSAGAVDPNGPISKTQEGLTFNRVVNAVNDLGMDPNGNQDITNALNSALQSGTLVHFPPGEYYIAGTITKNGVDNIGLIGGGASRSDVVFKVPQGTNQHQFLFVNGRNYLLKDFTMDQTNDLNTGVNTKTMAKDGLRIKNIEMAGIRPGVESNRQLVLPSARSRGGVNIVDGLVAIDGGIVGTYQSGRGKTMYSGPEHVGEVQLNNLHIENSGQHSMYGARTCGCIRVNGGFYRNNDNTQMRINSNHPDKNSWIKNGTFVIDTANPTREPVSYYQNTRGLKFDARKGGKADTVVEDCDVVLKSVSSDTQNPARLVHIEDHHPGVTFRNCRFRNETNDPTVIAEAHSHSKVDLLGCGTLSNNETVTFENCHFTGGGGGEIFRTGRRMVLKDCCIDMPNANIGGGVEMQNTSRSGCEDAKIEPTFTSGSGSTDSGSDCNYETITVGAGERKEIRIGSGESFTNKLIDISASGAYVEIIARGKDWEIKNVGVKGTWDVLQDTDDSNPDHIQVINAQVDDGSTATIDNFYFADGTTDDKYPGVTGIYVDRLHAGILKINNVNIQDTPNNAIYASTPGRPDQNEHGYPGGAGGEVHITDSYAADCLASGFRIGTDGSYVENSVATGCDRNVWVRFNEVDIRNSDLSNAASNYGDGDLAVGCTSWQACGNAVARAENTYFGTDADNDYKGTIIGSSASSSPRRTKPDEVSGVPLSAEDAACGRQTTTDTDSTGSNNNTHEISISGGDAGNNVRYYMKVTGVITDSDINSNDAVFGDQATGVVAGGSDSYTFNGRVLDFFAEDNSQISITMDGKSYTVNDFTSSKVCNT